MQQTAAKLILIALAIARGSVCGVAATSIPGAAGAGPSVLVSKTAGPQSVTGRVRVFFSPANQLQHSMLGVQHTCEGVSEPRTSCDDSQDTSQVFGVDATDFGPSDVAVIDVDTAGYPLWSLADIPEGSPYCVQAEFIPYDTYKRGDGVTLTLPSTCVSDGGADGSYGSPAGTLYSDVILTSWPATVKLDLSHEVQAIAPGDDPGCSGKGSDTEYIKTVTVQSKHLSDFWGRNISIHACVLLPFGFEQHPQARYPLVVAHGHYSAFFDPGGRFDPTPPTNQTGYDLVDQLYANYFYSNWTAADGVFKGARALVITIKHPVPFFDDSYAVDSVNVGPYGTAIVEELIPAVETKYRGIGEGWARGVMGGSTGGWESLSSQIFYPDFYNYAAVACPDPISFTSYVTMNLYASKNAYVYDSPFKRTARPGVRDRYSGTAVVPGTSQVTYGHPYGQTTATVEEMNRREIVLGKHSRSCGQWDIWEAVFGPKGADGYPARIWCKDPKANCTYGEIDKDVASYWRDNFDLLHIMDRDWDTLAPKLAGKLHIFVGGSDTFFLTNAVMDLRNWAAKHPDFDGEITIGTHDGLGYEHCFNGYLPDGTPAPNAITRELYVTKFVPRMAARWLASAPAGANLEWSKY